MANLTGEQLSLVVRQKMSELAKACQGVDEAVASRSPEGRWSPKEILSHLIGPGKNAHVAVMRRFLEEDIPTLDLTPENPFFTPERAEASFAQLASEAQEEYGRIADFAASLSREQLSRTARIPMLKESPLGEYPTLGGLIFGLGDFHLQFHIDHLREVLKELSDS
ncbi:MAG: DinB family protein [Acidobacteriota bacterium]